MNLSQQLPQSPFTIAKEEITQDSASNSVNKSKHGNTFMHTN